LGFSGYIQGFYDILHVELFAIYQGCYKKNGDWRTCL